MKVGFIGLGKMGAGICSNIVKNGIDVVVYDINPANMQIGRASCRERV